MGEKITNFRYYPKYHLAAPIGWINDPNGFCYYNGEYHLFYQYHPYSAEWGPMHWGHAVSKDLITWENLPIALAPDKDYDKDGCFSGSAIEKDGRLYLIYTGHVKTGEHTHFETQCLAVSEDGTTFKKSEKNPVIKPPQSEEVSQFDFRDPKIFQHGDKYYCLIGSQTPEKIGQVLLYESENLTDWKYKTISARAKNIKNKMWECPNLAEFENGAVLILSVIGEGYRTEHIIGTFDYESGKFNGEKIELTDNGSDFYAPQIMTAPDGRIIMTGWLSMWHEDMPEQADGWAGLMTVPREVILKNDKVYTPPVKELENLRGEGFNYENLIFDKISELENFNGEVGELILDIDLKNEPKFAIELRAGDNEKTVLSYENDILKLDRKKSGAGPERSSQAELQKSDNLNLRIFFDKSSVEIFINNGEKVISARIYPQEKSQKILFVPIEGTLQINSATFYKF